MQTMARVSTMRRLLVVGLFLMVDYMAACGPTKFFYAEPNAKPFDKSLFYFSTEHCEVGMATIPDVFRYAKLLPAFFRGHILQRLKEIIEMGTYSYLWGIDDENDKLIGLAAGTIIPQTENESGSAWLQVFIPSNFDQAASYEREVTDKFLELIFAANDLKVENITVITNQEEIVYTADSEAGIKDKAD